jgi:hypothetical protein
VSLITLNVVEPSTKCNVLIGETPHLRVLWLTSKNWRLRFPLRRSGLEASAAQEERMQTTATTLLAGIMAAGASLPKVSAGWVEAQTRYVDEKCIILLLLYYDVIVKKKRLSTSQVDWNIFSSLLKK